MYPKLCIAFLLVFAAYANSPTKSVGNDENPYEDIGLLICGVVKESGDYNSCLKAAGNKAAHTFSHQCRITGECRKRNGARVCVDNPGTKLPFEESQVFTEWNKRFYLYRSANPAKGEIERKIERQEHTCYVAYKCKTFCEFDPLAAGGAGRFACVPSLEIIRKLEITEYKEGEVCEYEEPNDPQNPGTPEDPDAPATPDIPGNPGDATAPVNDASFILP